MTALNDYAVDQFARGLWCPTETEWKLLAEEVRSNRAVDEVLSGFTPEANLGMARTAELVDELVTRWKIGHGPSGLDPNYRTVTQ